MAIYTVRNTLPVITRPEFRSTMDSTLKGFKKAFREDPAAATSKAERIIKNTYRTLMTRGQRGCYIYCTDEETAEYFTRMLTASHDIAPL